MITHLQLQIMDRMNIFKKCKKYYVEQEQEKTSLSNEQQNKNDNNEIISNNEIDNILKE